jgi:hypothetical protein
MGVLNVQRCKGIMKSILFIITLFYDVINSFSPFFYRTNNIIKSLSGLLQKIPSGLLQKIPYMNFFENNPNSIIETECDLECDIGCDLEKCEMIIPGYMEHDPKKAIFQK